MLKPGERAALVAPNGAGKSTLLKIVAGLESADSGRVQLPPGTIVGFFQQLKSRYITVDDVVGNFAGNIIHIMLVK